MNTFKAARDVTVSGISFLRPGASSSFGKGRAQIYRGEDSAGTGLIRRGKDGLEKAILLLGILLLQRQLSRKL
jgi:hypothetical protein